MFETVQKLKDPTWRFSFFFYSGELNFKRGTISSIVGIGKDLGYKGKSTQCLGNGVPDDVLNNMADFFTKEEWLRQVLVIKAKETNDLPKIGWIRNFIDLNRIVSAITSFFFLIHR